MQFRNPYNIDHDINSHVTGLDLSEAFDRTQQNFRDECDINNLVKLYARTGVIPGQDIPAMHFDAGDISDYHSALNALIDADRTFLNLPSELRARFQNDPGQLLDFLNNSDNREEAVKIGLLPSSAAISPPSPPSSPPPDTNRAD